MSMQVSTNNWTLRRGGVHFGKHLGVLREDVRAMATSVKLLSESVQPILFPGLRMTGATAIIRFSPLLYETPRLVPQSK